MLEYIFACKLCRENLTQVAIIMSGPMINYRLKSLVRPSVRPEFHKQQRAKNEGWKKISFSHENKMGRWMRPFKRVEKQFFVRKYFMQRFVMADQKYGL